MIINKKFDRLRQWTDERMGGKSKTETSDEFQDLEMEMGLRYEGMKRNQKAMSDYVKNMSQRQEGGDKEKMTPVALLGSTMATHGDDFANDSNFGQCLTMYGRTNERIARAQETYMAKASSTWLESTEKSLVEMKEYQAARKKMESRRLAYDTAMNKMEKNRKDDFRLEEEARIQKSKYEEANEDVHRRMLDIRDSEAESVQDMGDFLDAQLAYYDRCREILLQLKQEWPSPASKPAADGGRLSRCNTSNSDDYDSPPLAVDRTRSRIVSNSTPVSRADSRERTAQRPVVQRSTTFEGPRQLRRDPAPPPPPTSDAGMRPLDRIHSNPVSSRDQHLALRPVPPPSSSDYDSTPNSYATSPASSLASVTTGSLAAMRSTSGDGKKKAPPPPPPSRAKKPPPPPPPMRRGIVAGAYE